MRICSGPREKKGVPLSKALSRGGSLLLIYHILLLNAAHWKIDEMLKYRLRTVRLCAISAAVVSGAPLRKPFNGSSPALLPYWVLWGSETHNGDVEVVVGSQNGFEVVKELGMKGRGNECVTWTILFATFRSFALSPATVERYYTLDKGKRGQVHCFSSWSSCSTNVKPPVLRKNSVPMLIQDRKSLCWNYGWRAPANIFCYVGQPGTRNAALYSSLNV